MEPEIRTMLTQKIRAAESEPVTWNKQMVWGAIHDRAKPSPTFRHYYVAAVVVLLIAVNVIVLREKSGGDAPVETAVNASQSTTSELHDTKISEKDRPNAGSSNATEPVSKIRTEPVVANTDHLPEMPPATGDKELAVMVDVDISEPILQPEQPSAERIQPIVGVAGWSDPDDVPAIARKRKLLRKLDRYGPEWAEYSQARTILFARIK